MLNNNPFSSPIPEPTPFERDINDLVKQLKETVRIIHIEFIGQGNRGTWIYGIIKAESLPRENQAGISADNSSPFSAIKAESLQPENQAEISADNSSPSSAIKAESLQPENQDMRLFQESADKLLEKYRHNLTETEPKNIGEAYQYIEEQGDNVKYSKNKPLAIEMALWIIDVESASMKRHPNPVLAEIETLKERVQNFKDLKPPEPPKFKDLKPPKPRNYFEKNK